MDRGCCCCCCTDCTGARGPCGGGVASTGEDVETNADCDRESTKAEDDKDEDDDDEDDEDDENEDGDEDFDTVERILCCAPDIWVGINVGIGRACRRCGGGWACKCDFGILVAVAVAVEVEEEEEEEEIPIAPNLRTNSSARF